MLQSPVRSHHISFPCGSVPASCRRHARSWTLLMSLGLPQRRRCVPARGAARCASLDLTLSSSLPSWEQIHRSHVLKSFDIGKRSAKWVRLSGHSQLTWEMSTAVSSCLLPLQQDVGLPVFHIMSASPREMSWISYGISDGTKCGVGITGSLPQSLLCSLCRSVLYLHSTVGVVVSTSGTIPEAHQNSWEVLKGSRVSFIICRPPGKAALTITKWQLLPLQIHCLTTGLGFFLMQHFQLGLSENFLS